MRDLSRSHGFRWQLKAYSHFGHANLNTQIQDQSLIQHVYGTCKEAHKWSCHTFNEGYYFKCPKAQLLEPRLALRGQGVSNKSSDGVSLHESDDLKSALISYLDRQDPLAACAWCLGTLGTEFPQRQLNRREVRQEIDAEHPEPEKLIATRREKMHRSLRTRMQMIGRSR